MDGVTEEAGDILWVYRTNQSHPRVARGFPSPLQL